MFKVTSMRSLVILEETGGFCSYPYWAPSNFYHLLPLSHWGGPHQKWYPFSNMDMENDEQTWRLETLKIHQPWKSKTMKRIVLWGIACDKNDTLTKNQWFLAQRPFKVFGLSGSIHLSGVFVNRIPLKHFSFQDRYPCNVGAFKTVTPGRIGSFCPIRGSPWHCRGMTRVGWKGKWLMLLASDIYEEYEKWCWIYYYCIGHMYPSYKKFFYKYETCTPNRWWFFLIFELVFWPMRGFENI